MLPNHMLIKVISQLLLLLQPFLLILGIGQRRQLESVLGHLLDRIGVVQDLRRMLAHLLRVLMDLQRNDYNNE